MQRKRTWTLGALSRPYSFAAAPAMVAAGGGGGPQPDPYFTDVKMILPMNNASITEGVYPGWVPKVWGPTFSTEQILHGDGSWKFTQGTNKRFEIHHTFNVPNDGHYTTEAWVYIPGPSNLTGVLWHNGWSDAHGYAMLVEPSAGLRMQYVGHTGAVAADETATGLFPYDEWFHVATCRQQSSPTVVKHWCFVNGTQVLYAESGDYIPRGVVYVPKFEIGGSVRTAGANASFGGYMSWMRVTVKDRYTENFSRPLPPYATE